MAITHRFTGTVAVGTTSVAPSPGGTVNAADRSFLIVATKPNTATIVTPAGWTSVANVTGGTGSNAIDTGQTRLAVFSRDGAFSGAQTVTVTTGGTSWGVIATYTAAGFAANTFVSANDTTPASLYSAVTGGTPDWTTGDVMLVAISIPTDLHTVELSQAVTATGISSGTTSQRARADSGTGNDIGGNVFDRIGATGTATSAATIATDFSGAANAYGPSIAVRIREGAGTTPVAGSDTAAGTDGTATLAVALTPAADARTAVDAGTLGVTLTPATDLRTLVDAGTLLASFSGSELGGSLDAPSGPLSATLAGADTGGVGTEAYQLVVALQSAETGSQADAGTVEQVAVSKAGSDTATGTDAATLATSQTRADTGSASDAATLVISITGADLRSVVDTVLALAATHQRGDTASMAEGFTLQTGGNTSSGDTTATAESGTVVVQLTGSDTVTQAENRTLAVQLTPSEIVVAIEGSTLAAGGSRAGADTWSTSDLALLAVQLVGSDGVSMVEQGSLILHRSGSDSLVLVDNATLLAQLTLNEIVSAAETLATLAGPTSWAFVSASLRSVPHHELGNNGSVSISVTSISSTISF